LSHGENGESRGRGRLWPLFVGLPLIVIIAAGAVLLSGGGDRAPQSSGQGQQSSGREEQASGGGGAAASGDADLGHPALGDADAPVVLVEYSDYQ